MKKTVFALISIAFLTGLLQGQEVTIQDSPLFTYVYLECQGSYQQIPKKINEFMGEFFKQKLTPSGNFFSLYLNAPGQVKEEELQWRLGFPAAADAVVAAPLQKGLCLPIKIAVLLYVGPYEKVSEAYGKVFAFIEKNGYKPSGTVMEKYLDMNPQAVKPEELRTEIILPIKKN